MIKNLPLYLFLLWASWLSAQINEVIHELPVAEPDYSGEKTRFGRYRTGTPQHVNEGYKTGWVLDDSLLVPIQYYKMPNTYSDFMVVHNYEGAWGVIDKRGRTVLPFEYDQGGQLYVWRNGDPVCFLSKNGRQQFFDQQGKVLFETQFEALDLEATNRLNLKYANGWLVATKMDPVLGEVSAIANRLGKLLFPFKYYRIAWATPFFVGVTEPQQGKIGFCDWQGREITAPVYDALLPPDENHNLAGALDGGKGGLLDTTGRILIPFEYDLCSRRYDHPQYYDLKKGERMGMADAQGRIVIPTELLQKATPILYHSVVSEPDSFGVRATRNEPIRNVYWLGYISRSVLALYHVQRGQVFQGEVLGIQVFNDDGPLLVTQADRQQRLYDLNGKDLLGGGWTSIYPNAFRTIIYAISADKTARLFLMDGTPASPDTHNLPDYGHGMLPYGYLTMPDSNNRFALFDPYGKRLTDYRFYYIKAPDGEENKIAREKGYLRPGRRIVAEGMADVPARQVMTFLWIDDTGMIVNE
jgi:WG containing repeat